MAMALNTLLRPKGITEDLMTMGLGIVDGILLDKSAVLFVAKNVAIPVIDMLGVYKMPDWITKESEGMLGIVIYSLLRGGKK